MVGVAFGYPHDKGYVLWLDTFIVGYAFITIGVATWLMLRLRQAGRALVHLTEGSSRLSGSR